MGNTTIDMQAVEQLLLAAAIVVGFGLAGRLLFQFFSTTLHRLTHSTHSRVDDIVLYALRDPIMWGVTLIGVNVAHARVAGGLLPAGWDTFLDGVTFLGFTLLAYVASYRLLRDLLGWYIHEKAEETATTLDDLLLPFLRRLLLLVLTLGTLVLVLQYFSIPVGSFLATLGVGSLAVALAAQPALSDIISGFLILLDRRYRIGDRIELVNEKLLGDVIDIGLRTTRILTQDHRMVIVPNSTIVNNVLINHAYPDPKLRVDLPLAVAYGTDTRQAKAALLGAIRAVEGVQRDRDPDIVFTRFGEHGIEMEMRVWIDAYADKPKVVDRINEAAYAALTKAHIEIPRHSATIWHRVDPDALPTLRAIFDGQTTRAGQEAAPKEGS